MGGSGGNPTVIIMAKAAVPGQVKTRLGPALSPSQAACVHAAMLQCTLDRLAERAPGDCVLAVTEGWDATDEPAWRVDVPSDWRIIDQGPGILGQRLDHVWRTIGGGEAAFFGTDSPDLPDEHLQAALAPLHEADVAVGPTEDGGYWTLAAREHRPQLLTGIDWGTTSVYDQTLSAAQRAGLTVRALPRWSDVDEPADLEALRRRLEDAAGPALVRLRQRLGEIVGL